jgi:uncharacterized protein YjbI with pentapeptide repeats
MKYDVLNRWTRAVQFSAEISCDERAMPQVKMGLAVKWACETDAVLRGSDLRDAVLRGADGSTVKIDRLGAALAKLETKP